MQAPGVAFDSLSDRYRGNGRNQLWIMAQRSSSDQHRVPRPQIGNDQSRQAKRTASGEEESDVKAFRSTRRAFRLPLSEAVLKILNRTTRREKEIDSMAREMSHLTCKYTLRRAARQTKKLRGAQITI